jgi:uncharacterized protein YbjQ (UPF0145 family)
MLFACAGALLLALEAFLTFKLDMSVFTTSQFDASIWEPVKTIYETHTEGVSFFRGIGAAFTSTFGGSQAILNKKMDDVTEALMKKFNKMVGSDQCVVGFSIQLTEFGRSDTAATVSGLAMGTLLKRKKQSGGRTMKARTLKRRS